MIFSAVPDNLYPFSNGGQSPEQDAFKSAQRAGVRQSDMNKFYGGKKSNNKLFKKTYKSRKHKSRKHKSRKHKSRKHRNKINLKGGNKNGNIIVPTFSQSKLATSPYGDYTAQSAGFNSLYLQTLANSDGDNVTLNGGGR